MYTVLQQGSSRTPVKCTTIDFASVKRAPLALLLLLCKQSAAFAIM